MYEAVALVSEDASSVSWFKAFQSVREAGIEKFFEFLVGTYLSDGHFVVSTVVNS